MGLQFQRHIRRSHEFGKLFDTRKLIINYDIYPSIAFFFEIWIEYNQQWTVETGHAIFFMPFEQFLGTGIGLLIAIVIFAVSVYLP